MRFDQLNLDPTILQNVLDKGYDTPSPIQADAIPVALKGQDILGSAQTGTGKTAAFALPIIHRLMTADASRPAKTPHPTQTKPNKKTAATNKHKHPRALVLAPTRELATQIADGFKTYAKGTGLQGVTIYGGVGQVPQVNAVKRGVDVIIATPGRLLDLMNQGHVQLAHIQTLVLDEADRMLDMGFIHDITKITAATPKQKQTLFFSATLPPAIRTLAKQLLHNPAVIKIAPEQTSVETVKQSVRFVDDENKADVLADLIEEHGMFRTIVFTRTKHGADKVVKQLKIRGLKSEAIHGNKSQNARQRALNNFKEDKTPVLVATDVAARGIDVKHVSHVVNFDLTHEPETYVHRIGRTGRAGEQGDAISLCTREELAWLKAIEKLLGKTLPTLGDRPAWANQKPGPTPTQGGNSPGGRRQQGKPRPPRRGQGNPANKEASATRKPRGKRKKADAGKPFAKPGKLNTAGAGAKTTRPKRNKRG